jgi:hypothetical protein
MGEPEREPRRFPDWAERERSSDLAWIAKNLHVLWPAAQMGYQERGRGALLVDTLTVVVHEAGAGNLMLYVTEAQIEEKQEEDALRLVRAYDPAWELVTILLKTGNRESVYRVGIPSQRPRTRR